MSICEHSVGKKESGREVRVGRIGQLGEEGWKGVDMRSNFEGERRGHVNSLPS